MVTSSPGRAARPGRRWLGLAGALLAGVGDMLILGRTCSGPEFDQGVGAVPPGAEVDPRWRSLWNGAGLPRRRIQAGTLVGLVGIALFERFGLRPVTRDLERGPWRRIAAVSSAGFAVSGVLTHLSCGAVILAYREALTAPSGSTGPARAPRWATGLLAGSAVATFTALAALSVNLTVARRRGRAHTPVGWSAVTPLPCVLATMLTFGRLPAPVGGYLRPASISIGLATYLAAAAVNEWSRHGTSRG